MIINHNLASLNTLNALSKNEKATSSSLQKLSSGLRINTAADDAAGLAISEKMRGQIRGLDQASSNSQDGISLVQTAEGALNETTSILQRMRELAVQSSNDTSTDDDRAEMQKEVAQLKTEINRISTTTEFNTKKLLNGSITNTATVKSNAHSLSNVTVTSSDLKADTYSITTTAAATVAATANTNTTGMATTAFDFSSTTAVSGLKMGDYTMTLKSTGTANTFDITLTDANGTTVASGSAIDVTAGGSLSGTLTDGTATKFTLTADTADTVTAGTMNFTLGATYATNALKITNSTGGTIYADSSATGVKISDSTFDANGIQFDMSVNTALSAAGTSVVTTTNNALTLQIGANEGQTMQVAINEIDTTTLDISNIDISTQTGAESAITAITEATQKVSSERAKLGAIQNRLEHTINNLSTTSENLTSAESQIRDVDMAKEMANYQKNSVLQQAAQAMLAQANQQPQQVLSLLK